MQLQGAAAVSREGAAALSVHAQSSGCPHCALVACRGQGRGCSRLSHQSWRGVQVPAGCDWLSPVTLALWPQHGLLKCLATWPLHVLQVLPEASLPTCQVGVHSALLCLLHSIIQIQDPLGQSTATGAPSTPASSTAWPSTDLEWDALFYADRVLLLQNLLQPQPKG